MRIGRWFEPRFVFVCQLVEVVIGIVVSDKFWEYGLALFESLVVESRLSIPMFKPKFMLFSMVPLVSIELEYHAEWCALKAPSIRYPSSS